MTGSPSAEVPMTRPQRRALAWIEAYQRVFAGRPSPCRFYPTCSSYAHEAFEVHGTTRGAWLTFTRLLRCRPFGPSGFDPVPEPHLSDHGRRVGDRPLDDHLPDRPRDPAGRRAARPVREDD